VSESTAAGAGSVAILFGPPGSGKGTQAPFIAATFHLAHVATGDMLRAQVAAATPLGDEVRPIMESGALVPDDLVVRVIEDRLRSDDARGGTLLDGFPRTVPQAQALDAMLQRSGKRVSLVLFLEVPTPLLVERLLERAAEEGRSDDTPQTVQRRMQVYEEQTAPVLDHYERSGVPIRRIDGVGSIDEVQSRLRTVLAAGVNGSRA